MDVVVSIILIGLLFAGYFTPAIVATVRDTNNFGAVMVVNIFTGWTGIGWIVALALAVSGSKKVKTQAVSVWQ